MDKQSQFDLLKKAIKKDSNAHNFACPGCMNGTAQAWNQADIIDVLHSDDEVVEEF